MAHRSITKPFNVAFQGIVHTFRTQKHMRIQVFVALTTVLGAFLLNVPIREMLVMLFMITLVLVAEMFNSAIEATVDLVSPNYHPLAKFAKDIAAGAVLLTTVMAVIVGGLLAVGDEQWERIRLALAAEEPGTPVVFRLIAGTFAAVLVVIIGKGLGRHGTVQQGGLVSGHAAVGFFWAVSVLIVSGSPLFGGVAVLLAGLVAQSRYEARFHTIFELSMGGLVGVILALLLFAFMP
jgi:diacylglycerol kinase (ATP)